MVLFEDSFILRSVRLKTNRSKKSTFSDPVLMSFFWKPISKLVISQNFRTFGHSLTDRYRVKVRVWCSNRHFFKIWPFSLKLVPFSQFFTKTYIWNKIFSNEFSKIIPQGSKVVNFETDRKKNYWRDINFYFCLWKFDHPITQK